VRCIYSAGLIYRSSLALATNLISERHIVFDASTFLADRAYSNAVPFHSRVHELEQNVIDAELPSSLSTLSVRDIYNMLALTRITLAMKATCLDNFRDAKSEYTWARYAHQNESVSGQDAVHRCIWLTEIQSSRFDAHPGIKTTARRLTSHLSRRCSKARSRPSLRSHTLVI
jgi:hypothetical protein